MVLFKVITTTLYGSPFVMHFCRPLYNFISYANFSSVFSRVLTALYRPIELRSLVILTEHGSTPCLNKKMCHLFFE